MNQSLKQNPKQRPNSNSSGILNEGSERPIESVRADCIDLVINPLGEAEVIACEIAALHLDLLFKCLHDFQLGTVSRARLIEQFGAHATAVNEVREILNEVDVESAFRKNEIDLSEKIKEAS